MKRIYLLAVLAAAFLLGACGSDDKFTVECKIEGAGSQSVVVTYYAQGGLQRLVLPASEGKLRFEVNSPRPTLVVVDMADGTHLATFVAANGDEIQLATSLKDPLQTSISGNEAAAQISGWLKSNAEALRKGDAMKINRSIGEFVGKNRDKIASTALLVSYYRTEGYETSADSLFSMIEPDMRPVEVVQGFNTVLSSHVASAKREQVPVMTLYDRSDSLSTFNPIRHSYSLLCFMPEGRATRDSIVPVLRRLTMRYPDKRLGVVEISCAGDSATWRSSLGPDSVSWIQAWRPAAVASYPFNKLGIPRLPFFIVADSLGKQQLRTHSIREVQNVVDQKLMVE